ncbi:hypothetical protein M899_1157 [Bacteriovorax sp. BSW11_IV]|uniref:hypothetical protein n=1 Tax=Bacteriovorax sp. BSW11_IV TaxID=1353529 RepID=UPI00038A1D04|nr:hypothetical protein [Bacteriovorax sp. BSW11_IV]EQC46746.1 hypothetical protein M899_1157 [Bacteriovorax sp. BSW11_IV]
MKKDGSLADNLSINIFRELKHNILIRNNTSKTEVVDPSVIQLVELGDHSATLNVPKNICGLGHLLSLYIFNHPMKRKLVKLPTTPLVGQILITGRVQEISIVENEEDRIHIVVEVTSSLEEWKKITELYSEHQKKIANLFK